jgi:uncharacterized protein YneF (UPF0154 family)
MAELAWFILGPVGLEGNQLHMWLACPCFAAFWVNRMTIDRQIRQNPPMVGQVFTSMLQAQQASRSAL